MTGPLAAAATLSEGLLSQADGAVTREQLDLLATAGLYGLFAPGPDFAPAAAYRAVEVLAAGNLATAFVWLQHHSAVRAVAASEDPAVPAAWLDALSRGTLRAGVALGGLRPGPPALTAVPAGTAGPAGDFRLSGAAPWVTGWGLIDVLLVAARGPDDIARWFLIDATETPSLTTQRLELQAVNDSRTVHIGFSDYLVPAGRLVTSLPFAQWPARDAAGLRGNGSLALGLAGRCCRELTLLSGISAGDGPAGDGPAGGGPAGRLRTEIDAVRDELDAAGPDRLPAARAAASALALRAASTLYTATGAPAALAGSTAGRLLREAGFLLVFASRPAIRADLLRRLPG